MASVIQLAGVATIGLLLALPVLWAWTVVLWYLRQRNAGFSSTYHPPVCVILSVRGADPSLDRCLTGLLHQDYPAYQVFIIVDSAADPAWERVREILARGCPSGVQIRVEVLQQHRETCSLKVSGTLQVLGGLDEQVEVVALLDADVIAPPNWLRSLVAPLADPRVGATSGFRWFAPTETSWGSLVRYLWNAAAVTQMYAFGISWAGSLAFHARVFRHPRARQRWLQSFSEDTGTSGLVRELGQQLRFVAQATMINPESIDLASCCSFIRRQLFVARIQHFLWTPLWMVNAAITAALLAATVLLAAGLWTGTWHWVMAVGSLLGFYVGGLGTALLVAEPIIRDLARRRGEKVPAFPRSWRFPCAALLSQAVHFGCLISALRARRIVWRGIAYDIHGPHNLRLLEYKPYQTVPVRQASQSIL